MKKHPDADALAARLVAAANQPPMKSAVPATTQPLPPPTQEATTRKLPKKGARQKDTNEPEENTIPISLRPGRTLLDRYVIAAADRTREAGRVISAQQIMLEVLERGI